MDKSLKVAALYVATLKAISLIHQYSHWTSQGEPFYGDHLLFERLYKNVLEDLDAAGEKFIGLFGTEYLDYNLQTELLAKVLDQYSDISDDPIQLSMQIEEDFIKFSKNAYDCFEEEKTLTLGLDEFLMQTADRHEGSIYLLKQRGKVLNPKEIPMNERDILKKLLKVAENQQKILTKIAQAIGSTPPAQDHKAQCQELLDGITGKNPAYSVDECTSADGMAYVKLKVPQNDPRKAQIVPAFKAQVAQNMGITPDKVQLTQMFG